MKKVYYWTKWKHCGLYDGSEDDYVEEAPDGEGGTSLHVMWPTNLMGQVRIQAEMSYGDSSFIGYGLCFFVLTLFTIFFVFIYLKRVLYMAFLTMIAPLVALTYPIDKISDGQAQAFNKWLKEYIFNLLIQPLHLLLYTILVTSAFDLAGKNILYSLVAIGFLIPAEKLMRSLFGFEKAATAPSMAGAAVGAGLVNTGLQKLLHKGPSGGGGRKGGKGGDSSDDESGAPARIGYNNNFDSEETLSRALSEGDEGRNPSNEQDDLDGNRNQGYGLNAGRDYPNPGVDENGAESPPITDGYNPRLGNPTPSDSDNPSIDDGESDSSRDYSIAGDLGRAFMSSRAGRPVKKIGGAVGNAAKWTGRRARAVGDRVGNVKRGIQNNDRFRYLADSKEGQFLKGAGRAMKYTAKQGIRQGIRTARNMAGNAIASVPSVLAKGATGAALGAAAGLVGTGVAIASGDPSNLLTYGGGAAATAATVGASRINIVRGNTKSATQIAREKAFYGDRYEEHIAAKNLKEWKKDETKREELEQYLGADQVKKLYEGKNPIIDTYLKNDVTDVKDIVTIEKMLQKDIIASRDHGIALQSNVNKKGELKKQDREIRENWRKDDSEKYQKRGFTKEQADKMAERQQEQEIKYFDIRKKL